MQRLIVLDVVGLTPSTIGANTPHLAALAKRGSCFPLECPFPALTLSSQASILTGKTPHEHGIVGNGWYWPELGEVMVWRQPHALLEAEDCPTRLRRERKNFTVAKLFWWFNMYAPVDWAVTPRPMYPADGRKVPDIHTQPSGLREELQSRFGTFPLFKFWGPGANIESTAWIADASLHLLRERKPRLSLVYLPHLDYDFQRFGPNDPRSVKALAEVDAQVGRFLALADEIEAQVLVLSEYGITEVSRVVHPNRILGSAGFTSLRSELGTLRLDAGASRAFAVADHQIAHIYVRDRRDQDAVRRLFEGVPGVERVLFGESLKAEGLAHRRSGDLVLVAEKDAWFTYYFWDDDALAPDYARTVDIHRKPGYDPVELFLDPTLKAPKLKIATKLLRKKLGFRTLLDVISLDASLVRGSHGRRSDKIEEGPVLLGSTRLPSPSGRCFRLQDLPALIADLTRDD